MERLQYLTDESAVGMALEDADGLFEPELPEHKETGADSASTDDPVRVYLREMGSVRLLTRQGEIDLAKRMERGKLKICKSLSRSPLAWRRALEIRERIYEGEIPLEHVVELGTPDDEAAARRVRAEVSRRFTIFARLYQDLAELEAKIASMPERYVKARASLFREVVRLKILCSQQF